MLDAEVARAVLSNPDSYTTPLMTVMADRFGEDFLQVDPATIQIIVHNVFGVDLPRSNFNRLNGGLQLVTSDAFYTDLPSFIQICDILWDGRFDPTVFDPADLLEICWGIIEALLIWPPDREEESPFSEEIVNYIGQQLVREAVLRPPDVLRLGVIPDKFSWSSVTNMFADDPDMFGAVEQIQAHKTENINEAIRERLEVLVQQLTQVGLQPVAEKLQERLTRSTVAA